MGMAASQARFLGLTARKTNVEYEGQQVNQQRTTLSNQSANYYNQLLGITVPTPPSVQDYTKTVYSFEDGSLSNQITSLVAKENGMYKASYTSSWLNDFTPVSAGSAIIFKDNSTYKIGNETLDILSSSIDRKGTYYNSLTPEQQAKLREEEESYKKMLDKKFNNGVSTDWYVRYVQDTTSGVWSAIFYNKDNVEKAQYDQSTGISQSNIRSYKIGSAVETEEVKGVDARLEKDSTGRYISITLFPNPDDQTKSVTYSLTTSTITDQDAYNDAMNQYEYNKYQYDQSIQEINAKIEVVQAEDRTLELRLKQLDTEQDAIQTEMDAVKKVIEKNTESTFKTFG